MNLPKCCGEDYTQFPIASSVIVTCTKATQYQSFGDLGLSHDSYTRLLRRMIPNTETLWTDAADRILLRKIILMGNDVILSELYAKIMEFFCRHWSGKHHRIVKGINPITLIYDKYNDEKTKNNYIQNILIWAKESKFPPEFVLFDSRYASLDTFEISSVLK